MSKIITESGMNFIADNTFHIEKSSLYTQLGDSVKSVEFIRAINGKLLFVEAKSSFPNPSNTTPNPNKNNKTGKELFCEEITDICDKFTLSLNLYAAAYVGVTNGELPSDYNPDNRVLLMFIVVINGFKQSWCDKIEKALTNQIRKSILMSKIWKPTIVVVNNITAAKHGLIST
jgi:hypothetical protein